MTILPLNLENAGYETNSAELLSGLTLSLQAGSRTVVLGANGAGKSSFLRLCHGLIKPTSGNVRWANAEEANRFQAFVFQRPVLLRRSAVDNLVFALKARKVAKSSHQDLTEQALALVGLSGKANQPARSLSIGEQQKLAIARAVVLSPEILFMDEPTSSLDPEATAEIEKLVDQLHEDGTKIVMSTHNLRQAKRMADEVIFIHKGKLAEQTPAQEFFEKPRTEEARNFLV